jgi:hypothetical protein
MITLAMQIWHLKRNSWQLETSSWPTSKVSTRNIINGKYRSEVMTEVILLPKKYMGNRNYYYEFRNSLLVLKISTLILLKTSYFAFILKTETIPMSGD